MFRYIRGNLVSTFNNKDKININLPNSVSSAHSNPLRNWAILFQLFGKLALDNKCLVGRLKRLSTLSI